MIERLAERARGKCSSVLSAINRIGLFNRSSFQTIFRETISYSPLLRKVRSDCKKAAEINKRENVDWKVG